MRNLLKILAGALVAMLLFQNCQKSDFMVITGVVRDSLTNQPLGNVYIETSDGHVFKTESNGTFVMNDLQAGPISLRVAYSNKYYLLRKTITVFKDRVNKVDFKLIPVANPDIETGVVSNVTYKSATIKGKIIGKSDIYQYGHCWSYSTSSPTIEDSNDKTIFYGNNSDISIISNLTGLQSDIIYYVRAYAITDAGTIYGNTVVFRTSDTDIYQGLLAFYPFNGNCYDQSGNGVNLFLDYGTYPPYATDRFGNSNSAVRFNGNYSNGTLLAWPSFSSLNDFSISLWFYKPIDWENSDQDLFCFGYVSKLKVCISQGTASKKLYFGINANGTFEEVVLNSYPTKQVWHNLTAVRNGSQLKLYIDGVLNGSEACSSNTLNFDNNWPNDFTFVGGGIRSGWIYRSFNGTIDDIYLYNRALTDKEIKYLSTH